MAQQGFSVKGAKKNVRPDFVLDFYPSQASDSTGLNRFVTVPKTSAPSKDFQLGPILQRTRKVLMSLRQIHQFWAQKWLDEQEKHLFVLISKSLLRQFANNLSQYRDIGAQREHCQKPMQNIRYFSDNSGYNSGQSQACQAKKREIIFTVLLIISFHTTTFPYFQSFFSVFPVPVSRMSSRFNARFFVRGGTVPRPPLASTWLPHSEYVIVVCLIQVRNRCHSSAELVAWHGW